MAKPPWRTRPSLGTRWFQPRVAPGSALEEPLLAQPRGLYVELPWEKRARSRASWGQGAAGHPVEQTRGACKHRAVVGQRGGCKAWWQAGCGCLTCCHCKFGIFTAKHRGKILPRSRFTLGLAELSPLRAISCLILALLPATPCSAPPWGKKETPGGKKQTQKQIQKQNPRNTTNKDIFPFFNNCHEAALCTLRSPLLI